MVISAIVMDGVFSALHLVPKPNPNIRHDLTMFSFNYTFVLNVVFGSLAVYLWWLDRSNPMNHSCHGESAGTHDDHAHAHG
jgi:hypothetical protein